MRARSAVGHYVLHDEIASGGMGTVYLGHLRGPSGFSRVVAIKQLHPQLAKQAEFLAMFLDEARLAGRVRHPNVVATIDVVESDGEVLIVMDYIQGESLSQLVRLSNERNQRTPPRVVSAVMSGVLYGLHAAHEATDERGEPLRLVHRDMSPQNVLVGTDGVARVVDFGVAKAVGRLQTTTGGQLKGKLAYMPPEQLQAKPLDRRADIYSAGVVLWEALTGERLFRGDNEPDTMSRVLLGDVPPPSTKVPGLPAAMDNVVLRALARLPEGRFSTAREMSAALIEACPPAPPHEVGEWVEACAHQSLSRRAARVADLESSDISRERVPNLSVDTVDLQPVGERLPSQVSSISVSVGGAAVPARRRWGRIGVAAGTAVVAGAFALGIHAWRSGNSLTPAASSGSDASGPPPFAVSSPLPLPPTSASAATNAAATDASVQAKPAPAGPQPLPKRPTPPSPRAPNATPAAVDCNPPYVRSPDGRKIWKRECLDRTP